MKKWISILLAICILGGLLCGCAQESPSNETNPDSGSLSESGIEETQVPLDIPETRYEDKQLVILSRDDGEWSSVEIFAEDGSADNISHAVYERNDMILQKYGVTILEYKKTSSEHQTAVMNEVSAPSGDFQAVTTSVAVASNMAMNSLLWDLNSEDNLYLDTSKPWWDERMSSGMEIGGKLFMVTGDLLTLDNDATFAIMFNKTIAEACKLPDLYDSVLNQAWTMEKIRYWEIWNEPDDCYTEETSAMWKGTPQQFYELYHTAATHLKSVFGDRIKVGGYAHCGFYAYDKYPDLGNIGRKATEFTEFFFEFLDGFFKYIRERGTPLDFFSWHTYVGSVLHL